MAYNKKTWVEGEVIYSKDLNNMEQGIYDAHKDSESGTAALRTATEAKKAAEEAKKAAEEAKTAASGKAPASHTHDASQVTGGTMGGKVLANATAAAKYAEAQMRNVVMVDVDPGAGASVNYPNGTVVHVFEQGSI